MSCSLRKSHREEEEEGAVGEGGAHQMEVNFKVIGKIISGLDMHPKM